MSIPLKVIIAVAIGGVLLLGGYIYITESKFFQSLQPTTTGRPKYSQPTFGSIQQALLNHESLYCDYTSSGTHVVAYIKNGMVKADIADAKDSSQSGGVLMKDRKIYVWNAQKTGFIIDTSQMQEGSPTISPSQTSISPDIMQRLEQYKQYCKVATVTDNEFVLPSDVKFTSQTQMMQEMPTGPSGANYQQQMQQYMQK